MATDAVLGLAVAIITATDLTSAVTASDHRPPPWLLTQRRLRHRYLHRDRPHRRRRRVISFSPSSSPYHRPRHRRLHRDRSHRRGHCFSTAIVRTPTASPPPSSSAAILTGKAPLPTCVFAAIALPRSVSLPSPSLLATTTERLRANDCGVDAAHRTYEAHRTYA